MKKISFFLFNKSAEGRKGSRLENINHDSSKQKIPNRLSKSLSDLQSHCESEVNLQQDVELDLKPSQSNKTNFFSSLKRKVYRTFHKSHFSRASVRRRFSVSVKNLFESRPCLPEVEEPVEEKSENNNTDSELHYETLPVPSVSSHEPVANDVEQEQTACVKRPPTSLAWEIFKLVKYGWYWGRLTPSEAERKLECQPDGAFLVRDSSNDCHVLSLSFRSYGRTLHSRIEHNNGHFSLHGDSDTKFQTVHELIFFFMERSSEGMFCFMRSRNPSPSMPVRLIKPVSRFVDVQSMQALCAYEIRQHVRMDNVKELPVPERLKQLIYYPAMI